VIQKAIRVSSYREIEFDVFETIAISYSKATGIVLTRGLDRLTHSQSSPYLEGFGADFGGLS